MMQHESGGPHAPVDALDLRQVRVARHQRRVVRLLLLLARQQLETRNQRWTGEQSAATDHANTSAQSRKACTLRTGPICAAASAFQMRTFMSSLPLKTYTPSPLKRTAKTLRHRASVRQRQT